MKPLLLALQFWQGDRDQAMALARTLADIGPSPHHLLFFARYDCAPDPATEEYCRKSFTVHTAQSRRKVSGWPIGPNAQAMDVFKLSHEMHRDGKWDYEAIMLLESDCVPLRKTWLEEIDAEWRAAKQHLLGCWVGSKTDILRSHMNGNLMFSPRLTFRYANIALGQVPTTAWDVHFWRDLRHMARASRLIFSDYRVKFTDCDALFAPRVNEKGHPLAGEVLHPAWLHGCKDPKALECVRQRLGLHL